MSLTSLQKLAESSWDQGIPLPVTPDNSSIDPEECQLDEIAKAVMKEKEQLKASPQLMEKLREKILNYSLRQQKPAVTIKACQLCNQIFSIITPVPINKTFKLSFDVPSHSSSSSSSSQSLTEITLPECYKNILAEKSSYFNGLFKRGFAEASSDNVILHEVDFLQFKDLMLLMEADSSEFPNDKSLEELRQLVSLAHQFDISIHGIISDILKNKLKNLDYTPTDYDAALEIQEFITESESFESFPEIQEEIDNYQEGYLDTFTNIDQYLKFTNKYGRTLKSLKFGTFHYGPKGDFDYESLSQEKVAQLFLNCPNLKELIVYGFGDNLSDAAFTALCQLQELRVLDYDKTLNENETKQLITLPNLHTLTWLCVHREETSFLGLLSQLGSLKNLWLCNLKPEQVNQLGHLGDQLQHLEMNMVWLNNTQDFAFFDKLTRLRTLKLTDCMQNLNVSNLIKSLCNLSKLEELIITPYDLVLITQSAIENLVKLQSLKILDISQTSCLKEVSIKPFSAFVNLEHLKLPKQDVLTEEDIKCLAGLNNLKTLRINSCEINRIGHLAQAKKLKYLTIENLGLQREDDQEGKREEFINEVPKLLNLQKLEIIGVFGFIDDECIASLSTLSDLQILAIKDCDNLSNKALENLLDLSNLKEVEFQFKNVTQIIDCLGFSLKNKAIYHCAQQALLNFLLLNTPLSNDELIQIAKQLQKHPDLELENTLQEYQIRMSSNWNFQELIEGVINGKSFLTGLVINHFSNFNIELFLEKEVLQSPNLKELRLNFPITGNILKLIATCNTLQKLVLSNCRELNTADFSHLSKLSNLSHLEIIGAPALLGTGLEFLSELPQLHTVVFHACPQLTPTNLANALKDIKNLKKVEYSYDQSVALPHNLTILAYTRDSDQKVLYNQAKKYILQQIESFEYNAQNYHQAQTILAHLSKYPDKEIQMSIQRYQSNFIATIPTLKDLVEFTRNYGRELTSLQIKNFSSYREEEIKTVLKNCPNLLTLQVFPQMTDTLFTEIAKLQKVQTLKMMNCQGLTQKSYADLVNLSTVEELVLDTAPHFTDACVGYLSQLPHLHTFHLINFNSLTGEGFSRIAELPELNSFLCIFSNPQQVQDCLSASYKNLNSNPVYLHARSFIISFLKKASKNDGEAVTMAQHLQEHLQKFPDEILKNAVERYQKPL